MLTWICKSFHQLLPIELYKILQLRTHVFVVEQNCVYQDCDNRDQESEHMMAFAGDELAAYTRLLPPGLAYNSMSIGRVVTAKNHRGEGKGRELLARSIEQLYHSFGIQPITIGAQLYLKQFYESFGFKKIGEIYLEDGIEHIKMVLE